MSRVQVLAAATIAAFSLPAVASAATILDDFSVDQQAQDTPSGVAATTTVGNRTFTVDNGTASAPAATQLQSGFDLDVLQFSNGSNVTGTGSVDYALAGVDLSSAGSFRIDLLSYDLNDATTDLTLTINGISSMAKILSAATVGTISFSASEFAAANLANVTSIMLSLDNSSLDAVDLALDNFRAEVVPLPAGAVLLLTGLAGLGFARRKSAA